MTWYTGCAALVYCRCWITRILVARIRRADVALRCTPVAEPVDSDILACLCMSGLYAGTKSLLSAVQLHSLSQVPCVYCELISVELVVGSSSLLAATRTTCCCCWCCVDARTTSRWQPHHERVIPAALPCYNQRSSGRVVHFRRTNDRSRSAIFSIGGISVARPVRGARAVMRPYSFVDFGAI